MIFSQILKLHSSALSGIGGDTGIRILHLSYISSHRMFVIHDVLYFTSVDKLVVSEG